MARCRFILLALVVAGVAHAATLPAGAVSPSLDTIAINDNRSAVGDLDGSTLTVRLETREGEWHPDRDADPGVRVLAFAIEAGPLQIPGPQIRVTVGTEIRAIIRNRLEKEPLLIHDDDARSRTVIINSIHCHADSSQETGKEKREERTTNSLFCFLFFSCPSLFLDRSVTVNTAD